MRFHTQALKSNDFYAVVGRWPLTLAACAVAFVVSLHTTAHAQETVWAYKCGNPSLSAGAEAIGAADALYILKAAVGSIPPSQCVGCVCDVNGSNAVNAVDALAVLRKSVGQDIPMDCPEDDAICTPCQDDKIRTKLRTQLTGPLMGQSTWILFDCADGSDISIDAAEWAEDGVTIDTDSAVIAGNFGAENRDLTFMPTTPCSCGGGGSTQRFLSLQGNDITVKGLTVSGFKYGISFEGLDGTIGGDSTSDAVTFSDVCSYSIKTLNGPSGGRGSEVRNTTVNGKCTSQTCTIDDKGATTTTSNCDYPDSGQTYNRDCYHISYHDVKFHNCPRALYASGATAALAKILVTGGEMTGGGSPDCIGPLLDADDLDVVIEKWKLDDCSNGLDMSEQDARIDVISTLIQNCGDRGAKAAAGANATFNCSKLINNGLDTGCSSDCGGLVLTGTNTKLNLGTQTSADRFIGKNHICSNRDGGPSDTLRDVLHKRADYSLKAENNWWCTGSPYTPTVGTTGTERVYLNASGATASLTTSLTTAPTFPPAGACQ